jgi:hypothetical protein
MKNPLVTQKLKPNLQKINKINLPKTPKYSNTNHNPKIIDTIINGLMVGFSLFPFKMGPKKRRKE